MVRKSLAGNQPGFFVSFFTAFAGSNFDILINQKYIYMTVKEWLASNDRDFEAGRALYSRLGKNNQLKKTFARGINEYNRAKLADELRKIFENTPVDKTEDVKILQLSETRVEGDDRKATLDLISQALLDNLDKDWKENYKEAGAMQQNLEYMENDEERKGAASAILDKMDHVQETWNTINQVKESGTLPEAKLAAAAITDPAKAQKRIGTLRSYISRDKDNEKKADKVKAWKEELEQLEKQVNGTV